MNGISLSLSSAFGLHQFLRETSGFLAVKRMENLPAKQAPLSTNCVRLLFSAEQIAHSGFMRA